MSNPAGFDPQRVYRNWNGGVNAAMVPDNLPMNASPWGRNAVLVDVSGQTAVPSRRRGFRIVNQTPIPGSPRILKLIGFDYVTPDTGTIVHYLLSLSGDQDDSRIDDVTIADGTITNVGTAVFTDTTAIPSVTVAQNCVFFANGTAADRKKVLLVDAALAIQPWGLEDPGVPVLTSPGAGSMEAADYEVSLSYRNEDSGAVSNRGVAATITLAASSNLMVDWSGLTPEAQVTHVKVHVRKTDLMAQFFEAGDYPLADGSVTLDLTVAQLNALILLSPTLVEYSRPPVTIKGSAWHLSRMFVFDETNIYWSALGAPEQFNPVDTQPVNPKDGGKIVAIVQVHDSLLAILKSNAVWGLYGTGPTDWELRVINPGIGCRAQHSAHVLDGKVVWWSEDGPQMWDQQGAPIPIGRDLLGNWTSDAVVDPDQMHKMTSCLDAKSHRVLWSAVTGGATDPNVIFPFNIRWSIWESHAWDPFEVSALAVANNLAGVSNIYAGNPYGRIFEFGTSDTDGARSWDGVSVTLTLNGTPTAGTVTTLTDTAATFDTEGGGLTGLIVYLVNGTTRAVQSRRIVSNTSTILTTTPNWHEIPTVADAYYIATPMFEWDIRWEDWDKPFDKKRFTRLYAQTKISTPQASTIYFDIFTRLNDVEVVTTRTLTTPATGGYWDVSSWDDAYFEGEGIVDGRWWIGRTGRTIRVRVRSFDPMLSTTLHKIGLECLIESGRR